MPSFGRDLFGSVDSMMDFDTDATPNEGTFIFPPSHPGRDIPPFDPRVPPLPPPVADGSVDEDVVITKPFGDGGKITCREIRRNSAGCLRFRNECEKCKEIQHIGENHSDLPSGSP